jgi:Tfp pilus assembly protein PilF
MTLLAMAAAMGGCANLGQDGPQALRIEPVLRVSGGPGSRANEGAAAGYLALAHQYAGQGRWSQAAQALDRAALLDPHNADIFNQLGHAQAMLQRYPAAVAAFERAVALAPQRADLLNNLGYTLMLDGRPALAAAVLTLALQRAPDHEAARINLQQADIMVAEMRAPQAPTAAAAQEQAITQQPAAAIDQATVAALPAIAAPAAGPLPAIEMSGIARINAPDAGAAPVAAANPWQQTIRSLPQLAAPLIVLSAPNVPSLAMASLPAVAAVPQQELAVANTQPAAIASEAAPPISQTRVVVLNGNGVSGAAARLGQRLTEKGLSRPRLANLLPYRTETTTVQYRAGFASQARAIARLLPMSSLIEPAAAGAAGEVRVIIGHDVAYGQACSLLAAQCRPAQPVAKTGAESPQAG